MEPNVFQPSTFPSYDILDRPHRLLTDLVFGVSVEGGTMKVLRRAVLQQTECFPLLAGACIRGR